MLSDDNSSKRAVPAVGRLTTFTYSGPVAWADRRRNAATPSDGNDIAQLRLELIDGVPLSLTYTIDTVTGRLSRKE